MSTVHVLSSPTHLHCACEARVLTHPASHPQHTCVHTLPHLRQILVSLHGCPNTGFFVPQPLTLGRYMHVSAGKVRRHTPRNMARRSWGRNGTVGYTGALELGNGVVDGVMHIRGPISALPAIGSTHRSMISRGGYSLHCFYSPVTRA